jgi:hypothetical protein
VRAAVYGTLVAAAVVLATISTTWSDSPLRAGALETSDVPAAVYLTASICGFLLYVVGLFLVRRRGAGIVVVCAIAAAIQLAPLAGPLLISRDVYAYWAYGRIAAVHHANPYSVAPGHFSADPADRAMAPVWRNSKSVYGPVFSAASAGLAATSGRSAETAALGYRMAAALGMLVVTGLAMALAPLPAFAAAFVGWNPFLAQNFAGGGHNDVWMMAFVLAALVLAKRRPKLAGASFAVAVGVKWIALPLVPLQLLAEKRRRALVMALGFGAATVIIAAVTSVFFGTAWMTALAPFTYRRSHWALPSRLSAFGIPRWLALAPLVLAAPWLVRSARRGRPRLSIATILLLLATPWLLPWYAGWVVPLAAVEEDQLAWALALAFTAYLLPDGVPL